MKTIKVIDLLNKIANGEEVPKKVKVLDYSLKPEYRVITWHNGYGQYLYSNGEEFERVLDRCHLDIEVEIIEDTPKVQVEMTQEEYNEYLDRKLFTPKEDKKIKRIQSNGESLYSEYIGEWLIHKERYTEYDELLMNKINEIIEVINGRNI